MLQSTKRPTLKNGASYTRSSLICVWCVPPLILVWSESLVTSLTRCLLQLTFYFVLFHLLVSIAHDVPFSQTPLPLCPPQTVVKKSEKADHAHREKILNLLPPNPFIGCSLGTGVCTYTNIFANTVSYNCLEQLADEEKETYRCNDALLFYRVADHVLSTTVADSAAALQPVQ